MGGKSRLRKNSNIWKLCFVPQNIRISSRDWRWRQHPEIWQQWPGNHQARSQEQIVKLCVCMNGSRAENAPSRSSCNSNITANYQHAPRLPESRWECFHRHNHFHKNSLLGGGRRLTLFVVSSWRVKLCSRAWPESWLKVHGYLYSESTHFNVPTQFWSKGP